MAPEDQIGVKGDATKDFDPLFWFLDKKFNKVDSELLDFIRSNYLEKLPDAVTECAKLSFYKSFQLLRITDSSMTKSRRSYALCRSDEEEFQVVPLNGTSVPIHETNRIPGELNLVEETAIDEYLRFFCSAVHGEDGPFLILDGNYIAILGEDSVLPKPLEEELKLGIQSEAKAELRGEFAKLSNPFPRSSIDRRKACVIYSSAIFRAWFAIDDSPQNPGMVQIVEDEPLLAGLKWKMPRYSDGSLFVIPKSDRLQRPKKPTHYFSSQVPTTSNEMDEPLKRSVALGKARGEIVFCDGQIQEQK